LIRRKRPDVIVTNDPTVFWWGTTGLNHPDHRAIGTATMDAVYPTARDRLNFLNSGAMKDLIPISPSTLSFGTASPTTSRCDAVHRD
jgi:LmbE family N-acetylglucosaminyl deacetylase